MASSLTIWQEARRRAINHIRLGLVETGIKPEKAAKMVKPSDVDDLLNHDDGEYIRVAFARMRSDDDD